MNKHLGYLLFVFFLLFVSAAKAQVVDTVVKEQKVDTVVREQKVDTVAHVEKIDSPVTAPKIDSATNVPQTEGEVKPQTPDELTKAQRLEADIKAGNFELKAKTHVFEGQIKAHIDELTATYMYGRGYINNGRETAARYILQKYKDYKLQPIAAGGSFEQAYDFPVNTFPGKMILKIDDDSLLPGSDFLIDPASSPIVVEDLRVKKINLKKIKDTAYWREMVATMDTSHAYYLKNLDDFCENNEIKKYNFAMQLPAGVFLIPEDKKLTWSVSRQVSPATIFHVSDLPKKVKYVTAKVDAQFLPRARSENIIGQVPGEIKDTFIAFTAHYDHLGMMGAKTVFPGASDNASGTGMLLSLARYFSEHPQHYSMLFIAFAGEEAALMGSEFFTWQPTLPLSNIKFLTNIDIMGDATWGVSVVNATKHPAEFEVLKVINETEKYLPQLKSRGEEANSDHYYFSEAGVPCFFVYSNGGDGHYHDIFDVKGDVSLKNIESVQKLLIDFVKFIK